MAQINLRLQAGAEKVIGDRRAEDEGAGTGRSRVPAPGKLSLAARLAGAQLHVSSARELSMALTGTSGFADEISNVIGTTERWSVDASVGST